MDEAPIRTPKAMVDMDINFIGNSTSFYKWRKQDEAEGVPINHITVV